MGGRYIGGRRSDGRHDMEMAWWLSDHGMLPLRGWNAGRIEPGDWNEKPYLPERSAENQLRPTLPKWQPINRPGGTVEVDREQERVALKKYRKAQAAARRAKRHAVRERERLKAAVLKENLQPPDPWQQHLDAQWAREKARTDTREQLRKQRQARFDEMRASVTLTLVTAEGAMGHCGQRNFVATCREVRGMKLVTVYVDGCESIPQMIPIGQDHGETVRAQAAQVISGLFGS